MSGVLVLMYHQVGEPLSAVERRYCVRAQAFRAQMQWLVESGYRPVSIADITAHLAGEQPLGDNAVHVTFDDGFVGVLEHALPALEAHRVPATLFALPGRSAVTNEWMVARGFPRRALLATQHLRMLAAEGVTIGSHSCTHARLPEITAEAAREEIGASKRLLEDELGQEVAHFAYPYGLVDAQVREFVIGAGYRSACSTRSGFNRSGEDPFMIRRIEITGTDEPWQFRQKVRHGTSRATRMQPLIYYAGRVAARLGRD